MKIKGYLEAHVIRLEKAPIDEKIGTSHSCEISFSIKASSQPAKAKHDVQYSFYQPLYIAVVAVKRTVGPKIALLTFTYRGQGLEKQPLSHHD